MSRDPSQEGGGGFGGAPGARDTHRPGAALLHPQGATSREKHMP